jgi:tRNA(Ile)-lysidine synthase
MAAKKHRSAAEAVRESGLIPHDSRGIALVSGGADSAVLAAALVEVCGPDAVVGVHLNYGLREDSDLDESTCAELCRGLGIHLVVESPDLGEGNVQDAARRARYDAAERHRAGRGLDWVASGHTRTDLAETILYRLVRSPGRRALLGLPPRSGSVVRPLLGLRREQVRELAAAASLPFRDDPTNSEPVYARNRLRNEVLPVLREVGPSAEDVIAETRAELAEEAEALDELVAETLDRTGAGVSGAVTGEQLESLGPAVRRLLLRQLAERAAGEPVALGRDRAARIARLAAKPEGGVVELGGGLEARVEHGIVRFAGAAPRPPVEATLAIPGSCRFGSWELRAELAKSAAGGRDRDAAVLDPGALEGPLTVRSWRDGDRMQPLGLDGTKSLQDLFTDLKVPRSLRRTLPVVLSGERIAWIAGVAVSEEFALRSETAPAAVLSASVAPGAA